MHNLHLQLAEYHVICCHIATEEPGELLHTDAEIVSELGRPMNCIKSILTVKHYELHL